MTQSGEALPDGRPVRNPTGAMTPLSIEGTSGPRGRGAISPREREALQRTMRRFVSDELQTHKDDLGRLSPETPHLGTHFAHRAGQDLERRT